MNTVLHRTVYRHLIRSAHEFDRHTVLKALVSKQNFPSDLDTLVDTFLGGQNFFLPSPVLPRSVADFARQSFRYPPSTGTSIDTALAGLRYLNALLRLAEKHGIFRDDLTCSKPNVITGNARNQATGSKQHDILCEKDEIAGLELLSNVPEPGALLLAHPMQQGYFQRAVVLLTSTQSMTGSQGVCLNKAGNISVQLKDYRVRRQGQVQDAKDQEDSPLGFGVIKVEHVEVSETDEGPAVRIAFRVVDMDSEEEEGMPVPPGASRNFDPKELFQQSPAGTAELRDAEPERTRESRDSEHTGRSNSASEPILGNEQLCNHFGNNKICCGGPVATHTLLALHGRTDIGGSPILRGTSHEVGLCCGFSTKQLQQQVSQGNVAPSELRFFEGECIWAPLQLEMELAGGAWICVRLTGKDLKRIQQDEILAAMRDQPDLEKSQRLWEVLLQNVTQNSGEYSELSTIPVSLTDDIAMLEIA